VYSRIWLELHLNASKVSKYQSTIFEYIPTKCARNLVACVPPMTKNHKEISPYSGVPTHTEMLCGSFANRLMPQTSCDVIPPIFNRAYTMKRNVLATISFHADEYPKMLMPQSLGAFTPKHKHVHTKYSPHASKNPLCIHNLQICFRTIFLQPGKTPPPCVAKYPKIFLRTRITMLTPKWSPWLGRNFPSCLHPILRCRSGNLRS